MTNNEKALELVQKCLDDWPFAATMVDDIMNRLKQVKTLLKEQEAVKPKLSMSGLWYECPVCNRHLTKNSDNYCARCGRPVLWEGR